jgi:hypothetical protein
MRNSLYLSHTGKLCIGNTPIQYDFERGAKIDLCLERVHEFLKRRKSTTLRLEDFLNGEDKKAKEQLLKKHDLIYFEERSSLLDAIEMFYEGIDNFLKTFSNLLVEKSNYSEKPFKLTEGFYSELMKIDSSSEVFNVILFDDAELETSQRLVSHASLRELAWEIYRDGENLKFSIDEIKKRNRKIVKAKLFDLFTGKQLEYNL